jgi:hypothetical protein
MGKNKKLAMAAAVVVAAAPLVILTSASNAYAGTGTACSGTSCSGLDPTASFSSGTGAECSGSSTTPLAGSAFGGTLQLRWGPNCQVNWGRFTPANNDKYQMFVTNETTGVWAGTGLFNPFIFSNGSGVAHFSDQVFTGNDPASVCLDDLTKGGRVCLSQ